VQEIIGGVSRHGVVDMGGRQTRTRRGRLAARTANVSILIAPDADDTLAWRRHNFASAHARDGMRIAYSVNPGALLLRGLSTRILDGIVTEAFLLKRCADDGGRTHSLYAHSGARWLPLV